MSGVSLSVVGIFFRSIPDEVPLSGSSHMYAPRHNAAGTLPIFRRERVSEDEGGAHTLKVMWQRGGKKSEWEQMMH